MMLLLCGVMGAVPAAINTLLTVDWKYHSSVVVLRLVPTALVAIQQQTRDISQYTVNNIIILITYHSWYINDLWHLVFIKLIGQSVTTTVHVY